MQGNGLDLVAWSELAPKAPFYLFIPQNESLREEYDKGWSVKDIFKVSGVGICSKRDNIVFQDSKEKLKELLNDFATKSKEEIYRKYDIGDDSGGWKLEWAINEVKKHKDNLDDFITQCHYRPFDLRWTFYTNQNCGFMARPVYDIFKHFLPSDSSLRDKTKSPLPCARVVQGVGKNTPKSKHTPPLAPPARGGEQDSNPQNENVGLNIARQSRLYGSWQYIFATNGLVDFSLMGGGNTGAGHIFPLYLKDNDSQIENFTPQFRAFVDKQYGESYAPKVILGYIYAVLYHKDYREKYVDFLKIDFPKVPFVKSKKDFLALSALGRNLIDLHLMRVDLSGESVGEPHFNDLGDKNEKIQKIAYNAESKRLFVNESLYFEAVSAEVWEYKIGGYAVLDKYLKSHKGESIDYAHFECVIKTLHKSLELESKIAKVAIE